MYVDLHIHTDASDGTWDTDELIEQILSKDITLFSITDHDTIDNSQKMLETLHAYPEYTGRFVIGAEVSCTWKETLYHITAYDFDPTYEPFQQLLVSNSRILREYNDATIEAISRIMPVVDYAKYLDYQHDCKRGGWKGLNFLLDEGIIEELPEFFTLIRQVDLKPVFRAPEAVLTTIKAAGGYPFMAHPAAVYREGLMPEEDLQQWIEFGITGLECYSTYCSLEESKGYVNLCQKHGIGISAGSDCHGTFILKRRIGHPRVTFDMIDVPFL